MRPFTKEFVDGRVLSYDGRIYRILLPDCGTAILKYSTVHDLCAFPDNMMEDGHLKTGSIIHLCVIDKGDKSSILPDHRYYIKSGNGQSKVTDQSRSSAIDELSSLLMEAASRGNLSKGENAAALLFLSGYLFATKVITKKLLSMSNLNLDGPKKELGETKLFETLVETSTSLGDKLGRAFDKGIDKLVDYIFGKGGE